jgi:hypothetical protein
MFYEYFAFRMCRITLSSFGRSYLKSLYLSAFGAYPTQLFWIVEFTACSARASKRPNPESFALHLKANITMHFPNYCKMTFIPKIVNDGAVYYYIHVNSFLSVDIQAYHNPNGVPSLESPPFQGHAKPQSMLRLRLPGPPSYRVHKSIYRSRMNQHF